MYKQVISLGFFCSVSLEAERVGLRDASYPFDWLIADFKGVLDCIENDFNGFLKYENMVQYKNNPKYYIDQNYNFHFYHDFNAFEQLDKQLPAVQEKYGRRIARFNKNVLEPTLFIRYVKNQEELDYIEANYNSIIQLLKRKNDANNLILISNDDLIFDSIEVFKVEKDNGDTVARIFLSKNEKLNSLLCSNIYDETMRANNLKRYKSKQSKKKITKYTNYISGKIKKTFTKTYDHNLKF